jgi:polyhydroxybutyrate depolymerase
MHVRRPRALTLPSRGLVALVVAAASIPLTLLGAGAAQAACTLAPTAGTVNRTLGTRSYRLNVPAGLTGTQVPLLISMHGAGATSSYQETATGWTPFASAQKFIVAYPQGIFNTWQVTQGSSDVAFLRQVVDDIAANWCVNPTRIYADGHSNGAYMSQRLACDAPDKFAAVVEYAGGSPTQWGGPCEPSRAIGVGLFQGEADFTVPASWGRDSRDQWVARNACSPTPATTALSDGTLEVYSGCGGGVQVLWRSYVGQGHLWPTGARAADQRTRMWSFLVNHVLP